MHALQGQAWFHALTGLAGPSAQQVPRAQPQMLGHQQPHASQIAADLIGQHLPHAAFQVRGTARLGFGPLAAEAGVKRGLQLVSGTAGVEFFFVGRTRR